MILRRLAAAIRKQDWFTVLIETLIVVLGVFLGLQAQQWAGENQKKATEAILVSQIHDEIVDLQALRGPVIAFRERWSAGLDLLAVSLYSESVGEIAPEECLSLAFASVVTNPTDDLATLVELESHGGLSLFSNERIRAALRDFLLTRARVRDSRDGIALSVRDVFERHPDLIRMTVRNRTPPGDLRKFPESEEFPAFECDLAAMRKDVSFLNDFEWTRFVRAQHIEDNALVDQSLANLHSVLDEALSLSDGSATP